MNSMASALKLGLFARWFRVQHLALERLLTEWRWLCPGRMTLVARSAFGDLFLAETSGQIYRLGVSVGRMERTAGSEAEFASLCELSDWREQWFGETDERNFAAKGLVPGDNQCIAFDIPLVFKEGPGRKPYLIDIYEGVSSLGNLHRQIADVPEGGKIKLVVAPRPPATSH